MKRLIFLGRCVECATRAVAEGDVAELESCLRGMENGVYLVRLLLSADAPEAVAS